MKIVFKASREPFVSNKRNFCTLTGNVGQEGRTAFVEFIGFSSVVDDVDKVHEGDDVTVDFNLGSKLLTDKNQEPVLVDGRKVWVPQLVMQSVAITGGKAQATVKSNFPSARRVSAPPPPEDEI
jgi:hypothetical protein